jgi:hypothetical protein
VAHLIASVHTRIGGVRGICKRVYGLVLSVKIHTVNSNIGLYNDSQHGVQPLLQFRSPHSSNLHHKLAITTPSICCPTFFWPSFSCKQHNKLSFRRSYQLSYTFFVSLNTSATIDLHIDTSDELAVVTR